MAAQPPLACTDLLDDDPGVVRETIAYEARQPPRFRLGAECAYLWTTGDVLYVRFIEPDPALDPIVLDIARAWCEHANISFEATDERDAHIRVTYQGSSNQSRIGRKSEVKHGAGPSMWLPSARDEGWRRRVVLHEFGHALGCIHEHSSPHADIPWNLDEVFAYYRALGRDEAWTQHNVLRRYTTSSTRATSFDPRSIMLYPVPAELLTDPTRAVGWNMELSEHDKQFIASLYPRAT